MGIFSQQVESVQNPALGAVLQARFVRTYYETHQEHAGAPFPLMFIVLPILYYPDTSELVKSTQRRSGLRAFAQKLGTSAVGKADVLLSIHRRTLQMRALSLTSIGLMLHTGLAALDIQHAAFLPRDYPDPDVVGNAKILLRSSEKLANWLAQVSLYEAEKILRVVF